LYSPPEQQPVLAALCQIEAEIAGSLKPGIDHHVAHARLQWWRDECERTAQGHPVHPLTRELVRAFGGVGGGAEGSAGLPSPIAQITGFVDTAVWDLAGATFETRKELTAYCERWAAAMFETAAEATPVAMTSPTPASDADYAARVASVAQQVGIGSEAAPTTSTAARSAQSPSRLQALGAAVREVELLVGLAREAHAGRLRVPLDELEQAGVDVGCLAKPPWPAALETLLRKRHEVLRATIADGVSRFGHEEQAPIRGLLVWASLAWRLSWRAQRALPNVILPRRYHAVSDGWHAWRAAHRATAGKLRLN
jgi:phytoene synthase